MVYAVVTTRATMTTSVVTPVDTAGLRLALDLVPSPAV